MSSVQIHLGCHCLSLCQGSNMLGNLLLDRWFQAIHELHEGVCHIHWRNTQLYVTEALDVVLQRPYLGPSLELLLCLLLLSNGWESYGNLLIKLPSIRPGSPFSAAICAFFDRNQLLAPFSSLVPTILIHWFRVHGENSSHFAISSSQSRIVGNPFPMNFVGGPNFMWPQILPIASPQTGAACPLHGNNDGDTPMKPVDDAAPGYTINRGDSFPLSSIFHKSSPKTLFPIPDKVAGLASRLCTTNETKSSISTCWLVEGITKMRGGVTWLVFCAIGFPISALLTSSPNGWWSQ